MNKAQEVDGPAVVSGGDASEVLEPIEASLDAVTDLVCVEVIGDGAPACRIAGDDSLSASFGDDLPQLIGIISFVSQNPAGFESFEQPWCLYDIAALSRREDDPQRPTFAIGGHMDLGRQASSGTPQSLIPPFCPPPLPVAAC